MLLNLASVVNADTPDMLWGFLRRYSPEAAPGASPFFDALVGHAVRYYQDFVRPQKRFRPADDVERAALDDLAEYSLRALPPGPECGGVPGPGLRGGQAASVPRAAGLVRQCLYQVLLGPGGGTALRGLHRALYGVDETVRLIEDRLTASRWTRLDGHAAQAGLPGTCRPCWACSLLVGAVYVVWKEFRHLKIADIKAALAAIPQ